MLDLLKNTEGDLVIAGNDLVIGVSDQQHREDLSIAEKGSIKQYPTAGVGARKFLEAEDPAGLLREIGLQFSADGMKVKSVGLDEQGRVKVEAPYA